MQVEFSTDTSRTMNRGAAAWTTTVKGHTFRLVGLGLNGPDVGRWYTLFGPNVALAVETGRMWSTGLHGGRGRSDRTLVRDEITLGAGLSIEEAQAAAKGIILRATEAAL